MTKFIKFISKNVYSWIFESAKLTPNPFILLKCTTLRWGMNRNIRPLSTKPSSLSVIEREQAVSIVINSLLYLMGNVS